jgi:hypothetical protein
MVFKLIVTAAKTWRRLKGDKLLPKVVEGVTFIDGVEAVKLAFVSTAAGNWATGAAQK